MSNGMETYRAHLAARRCAEELLLAHSADRWDVLSGNFYRKSARESLAELIAHLDAVEAAAFAEAAA